MRLARQTFSFALRIGTFLSPNANSGMVQSPFLMRLTSC